MFDKSANGNKPGRIKSSLEVKKTSFDKLFFVSNGNEEPEKK